MYARLERQVLREPGARRGFPGELQRTSRRHHGQMVEAPTLAPYRGLAEEAFPGALTRVLTVLPYGKLAGLLPPRAGASPETGKAATQPACAPGGADGHLPMPMALIRTGLHVNGCAGLCRVLQHGLLVVRRRAGIELNPCIIAAICRFDEDEFSERAIAAHASCVAGDLADNRAWAKLCHVRQGH